jgi:hypothetical protein
MNNFDVIAYVSLALINKGVPKDQLDAILDELWALFDELTPEEAAERVSELKNK